MKWHKHISHGHTRDHLGFTDFCVKREGRSLASSIFTANGEDVWLMGDDLRFAFCTEVMKVAHTQAREREVGRCAWFFRPQPIFPTVANPRSKPETQTYQLSKETKISHDNKTEVVLALCCQIGKIISNLSHSDQCTLTKNTKFSRTDQNFAPNAFSARTLCVWQAMDRPHVRYGHAPV